MQVRNPANARSNILLIADSWISYAGSTDFPTVELRRMARICIEFTELPKDGPEVYVRHIAKQLKKEEREHERVQPPSGDLRNTPCRSLLVKLSLNPNFGRSERFAKSALGSIKNDYYAAGPSNRSIYTELIKLRDADEQESDTSKRLRYVARAIRWNELHWH